MYKNTSLSFVCVFGCLELSNPRISHTKLTFEPLGLAAVEDRDVTSGVLLRYSINPVLARVALETHQQVLTDTGSISSTDKDNNVHMERFLGSFTSSSITRAWISAVNSGYAL